jgi:ubiquinone/menaquinone biosynthesis C-methylase UbiE
VGQESFMTPAELAALAGAAGVAAGSRVLDVCCGTGGPALYLARETGCRVVGADRSREAVQLAGAAAATRGLAARANFLVADALRLPFAAHFDAVLLLETMLAIEDKARLLREFHRLLRPGGRVGLTLEAGPSLTPAERHGMPEGDCIWLVTEDEFRALLHATGFRVRHVEDRTEAHADLARRLATAFARHREPIAAVVGAARRDEIIVAHARWVEWLAVGRVRKLALVAERAA